MKLKINIWSEMMLEVVPPTRCSYYFPRCVQTSRNYYTVARLPETRWNRMRCSQDET